jgi:hypothetical protein
VELIDYVRFVRVLTREEIDPTFMFLDMHEQEWFKKSRILRCTYCNVLKSVIVEDFKPACDAWRDIFTSYLDRSTISLIDSSHQCSHFCHRQTTGKFISRDAGYLFEVEPTVSQYTFVLH